MIGHRLSTRSSSDLCVCKMTTKGVEQRVLAMPSVSDPSWEGRAPFLGGEWQEWARDGKP